MGLDIRLPIGLMFSILGFALIIYGVLGDQSIYERSLGININLWWGIGLLVFGLLMLYLGNRRTRLADLFKEVAQVRVQPLVTGFLTPMRGLGILGFFIGGLVGFLLRPSVVVVGQLPFKDVITRGATLRGVDELLLGPVARTSFNIMAAGAIVGAVCGVVIGYLISTRKPEKGGGQNAGTSSGK